MHTAETYQLTSSQLHSEYVYQQQNSETSAVHRRSWSIYDFPGKKQARQVRQPAAERHSEL